MLEAVRKLVQQPENVECLTCNFRPGPNYIVEKLNAFVCEICAGEFRSKQFRCKGISVSHFTKEEVKKLELGGNQVATLVYMPPGFSEKDKPRSGDVEKIKKLVQQAFIEQRWYKPEYFREEEEVVPIVKEIPQFKHETKMVTDKNIKFVKSTIPNTEQQHVDNCEPSLIANTVPQQSNSSPQPKKEDILNLFDSLSFGSNNNHNNTSSMYTQNNMYANNNPMSTNVYGNQMNTYGYNNYPQQQMLNNGGNNAFYNTTGMNASYPSQTVNTGMYSNTTTNAPSQPGRNSFGQTTNTINTSMNSNNGFTTTPTSYNTSVPSGFTAPQTNVTPQMNTIHSTTTVNNNGSYPSSKNPFSSTNPFAQEVQQSNTLPTAQAQQSSNNMGSNSRGSFSNNIVDSTPSTTNPFGNMVSTSNTPNQFGNYPQSTQSNVDGLFGSNSLNNNSRRVSGGNDMPNFNNGPSVQNQPVNNTQFQAPPNQMVMPQTTNNNQFGVNTDTQARKLSGNTSSLPSTNITSGTNASNSTITKISPRRMSGEKGPTANTTTTTTTTTTGLQPRRRMATVEEIAAMRNKADGDYKVEAIGQDEADKFTVEQAFATSQRMDRFVLDSMNSANPNARFSQVDPSSIKVMKQQGFNNADFTFQ